MARRSRANNKSRSVDRSNPKTFQSFQAINSGKFDDGIPDRDPAIEDSISNKAILKPPKRTPEDAKLLAEWRES